MGEVLRGRYELLEVAGVGGEGTVLRTLDRQHDRVVALKIRSATTAARREDLLAEARVLLAVPPHPNLPLVREDFFDGDRYAIAMDWVQGTDLGALLRAEGRPGLPVPSVLRWLAEAAAALTHLHTQTPPVIHGDVKPANLILGVDGRLVLVDFGLSSSPATAGRRGGTFGFVAPELAAGAMPSRASDVYALAATAWTLLTGAPPTGVRPEWQGIAPGAAAQLEEAIRAGLATVPDRRPATAGELVEQIRAGWGSDLPTGVLTFCLTDIEGSTARWDDDPDAMARALVRHDDLVAAVAQEHGGRLLKSMGEGDATVSVFATAVTALEAAAAIHRAMAAEPWPGSPLRVRVGLHTGEAEQRGDDYFGVTLSVAARLRALAAGGEVFLTGSTAALVRSALPDGWDLVELGPHRLAGVEAAVPVLALSAPGVSSPPPATECPYRGLLAFQPEDRDRFFGREAVVDDLARRLGLGGLVAVVGSSGSGKSSLLRAGVAPRFPGARIVTPGTAQPAELGGDVLLVVDQFEELFIAVAETDRPTFVEDLLARPGPTALAVRADFYGHCARHPALAAAVAANQVLLGPMAGDDLRRAITAPAAAAGLRLEPGLVDVLVQEVAGEPGALPLLSHALLATWGRRDGRRLTLEGYRATGGVRGAIAASADRLVGDLAPDDQRLARSLLLRLIEPGDGVADTRRRARLDELHPVADEAPRVDVILAALAEARLLTLGAGTAEISHEALIREWPRLRGWLDEDREGLQILSRLRAAAFEWDRSGHDPGDLLRGARLAATLDWAAATTLPMGPVESQFLDACREREEAELAAVTARAAAQRRANRRLRGLLGATVLVLVAALAAGVLALREGGRADEQAAMARTEARSADVARLLSESRSQRPVRRDLALLLALEADRLAPGPEAESTLFGALQADPTFLGYIRRPEGEPTFSGVAAVSDGRLVVGDRGGNLLLFDEDTGELLQPPQPFGAGDAIRAVEADRSGRVLAVTVAGRDSVELLDVADLEAGRPGRTIALGDGPWSLAFGPDGTLAIGGLTGTVFVVDVPSGALVRSIAGPEGTAAVAFTPDGTLVTGHVDGVRMWDGAGRVEGPPRATFGAEGVAAGGSLAVAPDGASVLTAGTEQVRDFDAGEVAFVSGLMVWDLATGTPRWPAPVQQTCGDAVLAADAALCGSGAGRILGFELDTGASSGALHDLQVGGTRDVDLAADGRSILSVGAASPALGRWSLDGSGPISPLVGAPGFYPVNYAPDGELLLLEAGVGPDNAIGVGPRELWHSRERTLIDQPPVLAAILAGDGRLASVFDDGTVGFLDPATGDRGPLDPPSSLAISSVVFGSSPLRMAVALPGVVEQRDVETGHPVGADIVYPSTGVGSMAYVGDGLLALAHSGAVHLVDADTAEEVAPPLPGDTVAANPVGDVMATAGPSGEVAVHDSVTFAPAGEPLLGPVVNVNHMVVSDDGTRLSVASWDFTARVYDLEQRSVIGEPIPLLPIAPGLHLGAVLRPDGRQLAAVAEEGVLLWDLDPDRWRAAACRLAGRNLTVEEWAEHLPASEPYRRTCPDWP